MEYFAKLIEFVLEFEEVIKLLLDQDTKIIDLLPIRKIVIKTKHICASQHRSKSVKIVRFDNLICKY